MHRRDEIYVLGIGRIERLGRFAGEQGSGALGRQDIFKRLARGAGEEALRLAFDDSCKIFLAELRLLTSSLSESAVRENHLCGLIVFRPLYRLR